MLDHIAVQCADLGRSTAFYDAVLAVLGGGRVLDFGEVVGYGVGDRPTFWVGPLTTGEPRVDGFIISEFILASSALRSAARSGAAVRGFCSPLVIPRVRGLFISELCCS